MCNQIVLKEGRSLHLKIILGQATEIFIIHGIDAVFCLRLAEDLD